MASILSKEVRRRWRWVYVTVDFHSKRTYSWMIFWVINSQFTVPEKFIKTKINHFIKPVEWILVLFLILCVFWKKSWRLKEGLFFLENGISPYVGDTCPETRSWEGGERWWKWLCQMCQMDPDGHGNVHKMCIRCVYVWSFLSLKFLVFRPRTTDHTLTPDSADSVESDDGPVRLTTSGCVLTSPW